MLTDRAASPPAWSHPACGQACRSGVAAVAVEAFVNNAGLASVAIGGTPHAAKRGDRVLRGDHEERLGQVVRLLAGGDLAFLHRLQQGRLRLRRRAVDFVGEQDVREDRPFDEAELASALVVFVEHRGAGDVGRHQVGRELNAFEAARRESG